MMTIDRFMNFVSPEPTSGCWLWTGGLKGGGYGAFGIDGASERAHRASYMLHRGPIPSGFCVCHKCDNRACVNPCHLYAGTHLDNSNDKMRRGRDRKACGERNRHAKMTRAGVAAMRADYAKGDGQRALAKRYGITQGVVSKILRGELWKDG